MSIPTTNQSKRICRLSPTVVMPVFVFVECCVVKVQRWSAMFIYLDTATPRLMLSLLLIIVSRQGPMLMANVGCCVVTLVFGGMRSAKNYGISRNTSCVQSLAIVWKRLSFPWLTCGRRSRDLIVTEFITNIPLTTAGIGWMKHNNQISDLRNTLLQVAERLTSLQNDQSDSHEGEWDRVVLSNCKELKMFVACCKT